MNEAQQSLVSQFFASQPRVSQASCHEFVLDHLALVILPATAEEVNVAPCPYQWEKGYMAVLRAHYGNKTRRIVVNFSSLRDDLSPIAEAAHIHGRLVPPITYEGMHEGLFVYTALLPKGTPYTATLSSLPLGEPPAHKTMRTVTDLADIVSRGARTDIAQPDLRSMLDNISRYFCENPYFQPTLDNDITLLISQLEPELHNFTNLPATLAHACLTPDNYFIDPATGRVRSVIGWDEARYLRVGSNFHFMNLVFWRTPPGGPIVEAREDLQAAFYARVVENLTAQGFVGWTRTQLEYQMAIGMLQFIMERRRGREDAVQVQAMLASVAAWKSPCVVRYT